MMTSSRQIVVRRQARPGWAAIDFSELWRYRELVIFYAIRDIKVRYRQTLLGASWAILQPVLTMVVFSIFFGHLAGVPSDDIPYPIFAYCGLVPWQLFAYALTQSSNRIVEDAGVITKVYFPRLIVPLASVIAGLVDFAIAFGVLAAMMFYYGVTPGWAMLTLPLFTLPANGAVMCETDPINLTPGRCSVHVAVYRHDTLADFVRDAAHFDVEGAHFYPSGWMPGRYVPCVIRQKWSVSEKNY